VFDIFRPAKKRAIDELARALAEQFSGQYPLDMHQGSGNKKSDRKLTAAVDAVCARARSFHAQTSLDVYGKARLNNKFLWRLRDTGYDPEFIDEITKKVIISLSAKAAPQ
jgi:hypothetical protein